MAPVEVQGGKACEDISRDPVSSKRVISSGGNSSACLTPKGPARWICLYGIYNACDLVGDRAKSRFDGENTCEVDVRRRIHGSLIHAKVEACLMSKLERRERRTAPERTSARMAARLPRQVRGGLALRSTVNREK